ncbi:MAG: exodeoxyribonuclease VII large subunit [Verrucomicrobia bacterium]|nr:exodeoxyribonuclease VII large subunit [Verrucomicrobiota bacterium]
MRVNEQGRQYAGPEESALTVSRLVRRMRNILEIELGELWVEGEVSNMRMQSSGHAYFSLKDEGAQISCAMFGAKRREGWEALKDGAQVRVFGEVTIYEARGTAQLVVKKVEAAGQGDLQRRFEELKRKLQEEGLFEQERKQALPAFPRTIGLVTSPTGAALQDMMNVLSRRAPWVKAVLYPVAVQGKGAERGIARAIEQLGEPEKHGLPRCDVLIVGRGGGSLEDLWNFNEEVVARAIAACPIPVVSAVGHEIDFTIADFVADERAPTPSAAAELVVPDGEELKRRVGRMREALRRPVLEALRRGEDVLRYARRGVLARGAEKALREPVLRLDELRGRLGQVVKDRLSEAEAEVRDHRASWKVLHPLVLVERRREGLAQIKLKLRHGMRRRLEGSEAKLVRLRGMVKALGPESAFERGFSITFGPDGKVVRGPEEVKEGEVLETMTKGGVICCVAE